MPTFGRRARVALLFVVAAALALAAGLYAAQRWGGDGHPRDAGTLLAVALPDAGGHEQPLAQWRGKVLVVNWWATWCAPCREEMPRFVKAQADLGARGVQFVGIAVDEPARVQAFLQEMRLNYPALVGGMGALELSRTYGNRLSALPFTVVVDRQGRVAHTQLGPLKEAEMRALLNELM